MKRRALITLAGSMAVLAPRLAYAQPARKVWRIGAIWGGTRATSNVYGDAFLEGLRNHGYEIGRYKKVE